MGPALAEPVARAEKSDFSPVPIPHLIAARIYDLIVRGELRPGDRFNELQLSQRLGVSRAPIREAARLLENKGLTEWSPRRGFFVRALTPRDIDEIFEVRLTLEELGVRRFCADRGAADRHKLDDHIDRLRRNSAESENHLVVEGDMDLHRAIVAFIQNERFLKVYDTIANEMRLALSYTSRTFKNVGEMIEFHQSLLRALEAADETQAIVEIRRHLTTSRDHIKQAMAEKA